MVIVDTFDASGKQVGTRTVDMYHFGTRPWLSNHMWWAMHQGHTVNQRVVTNAEVIDIKAKVA